MLAICNCHGSQVPIGPTADPIDNGRTGRRSRWALELDPYDWIIMHKSGAQHTSADTLLRRPGHGSELANSADPDAPYMPHHPP